MIVGCFLHILIYLQQYESYSCSFVSFKDTHAFVRLQVSFCCAKDIVNYLCRFIWKMSGKRERDSHMAKASQLLVDAPYLKVPDAMKACSFSAREVSNPKLQMQVQCHPKT